MLLTGDLGFNVIEEFADELPSQFLNCGVAEQSMIGVAAGLAASGRNVFVYSIANFPTFRCLEQIRNDIAYHGHNVTIVSVGAGFAYGFDGYSHFGLEDLAIMRAIPGIDVICPADPLETNLITRMLLRNEGPAYLRLRKEGEETFHVETTNFSWGDAISLRRGSDLTSAVRSVSSTTEPRVPQGRNRTRPGDRGGTLRQWRAGNRRARRRHSLRRDPAPEEGWRPRCPPCRYWR
jgi:transketolase